MGPRYNQIASIFPDQFPFPSTPYGRVGRRFTAKEHLVELGQALYPHDQQQRQQWTEQACHRLKHEGGRAVRQWLEGLELGEASAELVCASVL